jgi:tRNA dimethylallyltransferase
MARPSLELPALDCWFLTGPTASGKTAVGLELARLLGAEIISLDSMAIYRHMDIGTAKPTAAERASVPHHLLDLVEPEEEFSLARYVEAAHEKIAEIRGRRREVLFVGGTPLYLKSLLRGIFQGPEADWEFRRQIEEELPRVGQEALFERLQAVDPLSAAKLHPNDTRRLIRALEVYKLTGQPISHLQLQFEEGRAPEECRVFVLRREVAEQNARIDARVDHMFAQGLVEEVRQFLAAGRRYGRTARQAVGYREVLDHLEGKLPLNEAIEQVKLHTRRFAKRQRTWFRSLSECRDVPLAGDPDPAKLAEEIRDLGRNVG